VKKYYHFTGQKLRDGRPLPAVGEWLEHDGKVEMCVSGLHASAAPFDALQFAPGEMLHQVELEGIVETQSDKIVAKRRKILASIDATPLLRLFARQQALSVIHLWDCPAITKEYLETGREDIRAAAGAAAWAAARARAWDAAGAAAWAAARAAAWDAAWAAAGDAARDAAWAAARARAWAAARAAARAAAGAAARARDAEQFNAMVKEAFDNL
jgi:hypothetical protein